MTTVVVKLSLKPGLGNAATHCALRIGIGHISDVTKYESLNITNINHQLSSSSRVTPEERRRSLARRAQETEQRRALFNAEADAEGT